jgi:hydroxyacylglutathione hydrolase
VYPIKLDNEVFEGENSVYLFGVESGPTTLVDAGAPTAKSRDDLVAGLDERGVAVEDLDRVLVTHYHPDHAGLAGWLQSESGATVYAHPADASFVARDPDSVDRLSELRREAISDWGIPDEPREELLAFLDDVEVDVGPRPSVDPVEGGRGVLAGRHELTALHLPGHTAGLVGFEFTVGGQLHLLSSDALLPEYTPNVGGADVRLEGALEKYLETLDRIARANYDRVWPGHRDPIDDPTGRAVEILRHHRERTERVVRVLDEHGPADAWTVGAHLFGDLSNIHILHGPGESFAHLDHLVEHGVAERTDAGYRLARLRSAIDLDGLFPSMSY